MLCDNHTTIEGLKGCMKSEKQVKPLMTYE